MAKSGDASIPILHHSRDTAYDAGQIKGRTEAQEPATVIYSYARLAADCSRYLART
jgi:hypothetical protein